MAVAIPQLRTNPDVGRTLSFTANFKTKNPDKSYSITFTDAEVSTVFEDFWTYSFYFSIPLGTKLPTDSAAVIATYFNAKWQAYIRRTLPNFERILAALYEEYDPLSNYDSHEEETIGDKKGGETNTRNPNITEKTQVDMLEWGRDGGVDPEYTETTGSHGKETTKDLYKNGFDSTETNGVHTDREVTTETGTTSFDHTPTRDISVKSDELKIDEGGVDRYNFDGHKQEGTNTRTVNGSDTTQLNYKNIQALDPVAGNTDTATKYNDVRTRYMDRKGNIGVTTSQQMIQSELELRVYDALREYIHRFAEQDLFYWTEDIPYDMGCYDWS